MWTVLWHSRRGPNDSAAGERSLAVLSHHTCTENSALFSCELAARGHRRPDVTPRPPPREKAIVGERQSARHKGPYSFRAHRPPSLAGTGEPEVPGRRRGAAILGGLAQLSLAARAWVIVENSFCSVRDLNALLPA